MNDTSDSQAGLSKTERYFARMAMAQTVTAVVAVVISCAALYATWVQARDARVALEAQVWPRLVSFTNLTENDAGEPVFEVVFANRGVGPAEVRSVRVSRDDEVIRAYADIIATLPEAVSGARIRHGYVNRRIFAPGEDAVILGVGGQQAIDAVSAAIDGAVVEVCYCSILGDCWMMRGDDNEATPRCPDHGDDEFRN
ncbi:MAG: hypothetical protein KIS81_05030 [Maricaulaceae bacterium]|nr:hypothetical protein [Maricaulaceae bacterium]